MNDWRFVSYYLFLFKSSFPGIPGLVISNGFKIISRSSLLNNPLSRTICATGVPVFIDNLAISAAFLYPICGLRAVMIPTLLSTQPLQFWFLSNSFLWKCWFHFSIFLLIGISWRIKLVQIRLILIVLLQQLLL